jgi:hypothetical protein
VLKKEIESTVVYWSVKSVDLREENTVEDRKVNFGKVVIITKGHLLECTLNGKK